MKFIVLDRDGVINYDSLNYIRSPDEWKPIPSSLQALARLNEAGYKVIVITNQSGIGRGYYTEAILEKIHQKMKSQVAEHGGKIHGIYHCPHHPDDNCLCRKPKAGLLEKIAQDWSLDLSNVVLVGDKLSDSQAAITMNMRPILVRTGVTGDLLTKDPLLTQVEIFDDLLAATLQLLSEND